MKYVYEVVMYQDYEPGHASYGFRESESGAEQRLKEVVDSYDRDHIDLAWKASRPNEWLIRGWACGGIEFAVVRREVLP